MKVDINDNRQEIFDVLKTIDVNMKPLFGKMSPQHVAEHLAFAIGVSTGKGPGKQFTTAEEGEGIKAKMIYSDSEMPQGIKNPILSDEPPGLKCANMNEAIELFKSELETFDKLYKENPDSMLRRARAGEPISPARRDARVRPSLP